MRSFRDRGNSPVEEVGEGDLMGGGEGEGIEGLKRKRDEEGRRKGEREVRREEVLRVSFSTLSSGGFDGLCLSVVGRLTFLT